MFKNKFLPLCRSDVKSCLVCIPWVCCTYQTIITHNTIFLRRPSWKKCMTGGEGVWRYTQSRRKPWLIQCEKHSDIEILPLRRVYVGNYEIKLQPCFWFPHNFFLSKHSYQLCLLKQKCLVSLQWSSLLKLFLSKNRLS